LILGGGPDFIEGGSGNDVLKGGDILGGPGSDIFYFRGVIPYYNGGYYLGGRTVIYDFQAGEQVSLAGVQIIAPGGTYEVYDPNTVSLARGDIALRRSGNDLILAAPEHPGSHGQNDIGTDYAAMTLVGFFARGLTEVKIDGQVTDVSGL
jgi:hypothetical protein